MWQTDSPVPEVAPVPSHPEPMQTGMPVGIPAIASPPISPVIAPSGIGGQAHGRFSSTVSLTKLINYKGKSSRMRNGIMVVLGIALVAGAVKLLVSSSTPKVATAGTETPAPAPAPATEPDTKPAKVKTVISANAQGSTAKTSTGAPAPTTIKVPKTGSPDAKSGRKSGAKSLGADGKSSGSNGATIPLASEHADPSAGYAVRFPAGWTQRSLAGHGSWLFEASDGKASSIAIGMAGDGGHSAADQQNLDALTKAYKARPDTQVQASGFATLAGRKCMFHKLSVPAPAAKDSSGAPARITTVQYFAPLGDGRALKVRVLSRPEAFTEMAPKMKQSLDTLRLFTPGQSSKQLATGE